MPLRGAGACGKETGVVVDAGENTSDVQDAAPPSDSSTDRPVDVGQPDTNPVDAPRPDKGSRCSQRHSNGIPVAGACHTLTVVVPSKEPLVVGLRWIPRGTFEMGSPITEVPRFRGVGEVQHTVEITQGFWMMETEVTQALYKLVTDKDSDEFGKCGGDCPIVALSWHEAAFFANQLSTLKGLETCFTCATNGGILECEATNPKKYIACKGWRLPTEAEWEYAYRARTRTALYNGDWSVQNASKIGWCKENQKASLLQRVARKAANAWGLFDMAGNVWEWTYNWHGPYDTSQNPSIDPTEPRERRQDTTRTTGELFNKVVRGGSWFTPAQELRGANRYYLNPRDSTSGSVGFRLVRLR